MSQNSLSTWKGKPICKLYLKFLVLFSFIVLHGTVKATCKWKAAVLKVERHTCFYVQTIIKYIRVEHLGSLLIYVKCASAIAFKMIRVQKVNVKDMSTVSSLQFATVMDHLQAAVVIVFSNIDIISLKCVHFCSRVVFKTYINVKRNALHMQYVYLTVDPHVQKLFWVVHT